MLLEAQVQHAYDGWGNLETFTQDVDSVISGGSGRASFAIGYTYSKATAGRQTVRRTGASYPGGSDLTYDYGSSGSYGSPLCINDATSNVMYVKVGATIVSQYRYLGPEIPIYIGLSEPGIYQPIGTTGGSYPDLDNFNRPIKSKLVK